MNNIKEIFNKANECKVLVIGDTILDKYYYSSVNRISPEAPVPIAKVNNIINKLGGAANVANNLLHLNCKVSLLTYLGDDANGKVILDLSKNINIFPIFNAKPTTTKIRIIGNNNQQMLRLDFEEKLKFNSDQLKLIFAKIDSLVSNNHAIIISDYNKGFCNYDICRYIISKCQEYNKIVIIDPKGTNWDKYQGATYITPNIKELNDVLFIPIENDNKQIEQAAINLIDKLNLYALLVTRSEKGLSIISNNNINHIPAINSKNVFDVTGAGDTIIAIFTLAKILGLNDYDAGYIANIAAGITITETGTYTPTLKEIITYINNAILN